MRPFPYRGDARRGSGGAAPFGDAELTPHPSHTSAQNILATQGAANVPRRASGEDSGVQGSFAGLEEGTASSGGV